VRIARSIQALVATAATAAAPACSGAPTSPSNPFDREVVLAPGQSARVDEARLMLRFDEVANDSRCPGDAICILGGDAVVQVSVLPFAGQIARYDLHTASPASATHGEVTLTLQELSPYPFSSLPFDPSEYRARIRLAR
jgi:hypothetical protein